MVRERKTCTVSSARSPAISTRRKGVRSVRAQCDSTLVHSPPITTKVTSVGVRRREFNGKLSHSTHKPQDSRITDYFGGGCSVPADSSPEEVKCKSPRMAVKVEVTASDGPDDSCVSNGISEAAPTANGAAAVNLSQESLLDEKTSLKEEPQETASAKSPPTPHKIQLLDEANAMVETSHWPLTPSSALSKLKISAQSNKQLPVVKIGKARRRLNPNQSQNQQPVGEVQEPTKPVCDNHKLTEFFPVRRSIRKTKATILEEKQRTLEECILAEKEDGLKVQHFVSKGRGVVTTRHFKKGEFVVEYAGELVDIAEAKEREMQYAQDQNTGCYMYYFHHKNQPYCVDATSESDKLGRLVNHSRMGNLVTKTIALKGNPRLVLIAKRDIVPGEELCYDYGDRSKNSLQHHPWLAS